MRTFLPTSVSDAWSLSANTLCVRWPRKLTELMNTKYQHGYGMIIQILSRKTTTHDFLPFVSLVESEHLLISASKASTSSALCCRIEWVLGFWHFHLVYNLRPPFIIAQDFPAQKKIEKSLHGRFGASSASTVVDDDDRYSP